jgi:hypothetical protein
MGKLKKKSGMGTGSIDWAQLSRLLPEDGERVQSLKHCS